jgi:hypothetical protein
MKLLKIIMFLDENTFILINIKINKKILKKKKPCSVVSISTPRSKKMESFEMDTQRRVASRQYCSKTRLLI